MARTILLFHGKGGSSNGSVSVVEAALRPSFDGAIFSRPLLRHHDPNVLAEDSLEALSELGIPIGAAVVGISLGGLIAAKLQETSRADLTVVSVSSPTWADGVRLHRLMPNRLAIYSSRDEVIHGRTSDWPTLGEAVDIPKLTHDTDRHASLLARVITRYLKGEDVRALSGEWD